MKYWMFQNNQVTGPYEIDDLPTVAGYCAETLVCPEGRKGTNMGDWQRASMVPELSVSLLKVSQLATVLRGSGSSIMGGLPPEPTLKDLAALGSLQERMELLDNTVSQLQESLKLKDQELLSLHRELDEKERLAKQMAVQVGSLEQRLGGVNDVNANLKEGLDKAVAAEHEVETTVQSQARTIEELTKQLADLQSDKARLESGMAAKGDVEALRKDMLELEEVKAQIKELKERPIAAAPAAAPSPFAAPEKKEPLPSLDMPAPGASPFSPQAAPKPFGEPPKAEGFPSLQSPAASPAPALGGFTPLGTPAATSPAEMLGAPSLNLAPAPSPIPETTPPVSTPSPTAAPTPAPGAPVTGSVIGAAPSIVDAAMPAPAKKKSNVFVFVVLALGAVGGFAAVKLGLIGGKKSAPAVVDRAPLPPPMPVEQTPPPKPPTPSPEEILEGKKKDAIALVDSWIVAPGKTVGMTAADGTTPSDGAATPWMAEPMPGKTDVFQVNFYAEKPGMPAVTYEFEADLNLKKVIAHNAAAKDLLAGKSTAPRRKKGRKGGAKAAKPAKKPAAEDDGKPILEDLLVVNPDDDKQMPAAQEVKAPAEETPKPKKAGRKSRIKPANDAADLDSMLSDASEPAVKPKIKAKDQKKEETLDDLLVPGAGGKGALDEPAAQPAAAPADDTPAAESAADESGGAAPPPAHPEQAAPPKKGADEALDDLLKP